MVKNKAEVVTLLPFSFHPLIMTIVAKGMNNLTFRCYICLVEPLIIAAFYIVIYALKGIQLIAANLETAVKDGKNQEAREALALGSLYGGLCLGPVNTAAVHALSYPLGGEFHIPHGLSNAILLPSVMKFNAEACPKRYAEVAAALLSSTSGSSGDTNDIRLAQQGVDFIYRLAEAVGIPKKLTDLGIPQSAVDGMAKAAMEVQRLLKNNPREVTEQDAKDIYNSLY